jgi:uncharacterized membrane protein YoaK (UPF0700 family)
MGTVPVEFRVAGDIFFLMSLAFIFGYIDCNSLYRFGVYACAITGNIVTLCVCISYNPNLALQSEPESDVRLYALFLFITILTTTFVGPMVSCYIAIVTDNRWYWFATLSVMLAVGSFLIDGIEWYLQRSYNDGVSYSFTSNTPYVYLPMSIPVSGLVHWALKLPYVTMFQTLNVQKVGEAFYRYLAGIYTGGSKARGDSLTITLIVLSFAFGAFVNALWITYLVYWSLMPVIAVVLVANGLLIGKKQWYKFFGIDEVEETASDTGGIYGGRTVYNESDEDRDDDDDDGGGMLWANGIDVFADDPYWEEDHTIATGTNDGTSSNGGTVSVDGGSVA